MWCWRRLLRNPWTAFRTNVSIVEVLKVKERLSSTVQIRILNFFGHITRNDHSMERIVVQGKLEGKRSRGRSPTCWTDITKAATQTSIVQCSQNAEDRNKWRITGAAVAKENVSSLTTTTLSIVND
ncbi:jg22989 [Pararge aegeria aegeria]|uniref:Jg22989 protein n=1 Tax=Pararge aegeria aegeria TaxID=348720 RepID=A0A8S4QRG5_9NEOP|nr:jg22989 [Pararge aegeria aegeria]